MAGGDDSLAAGQRPVVSMVATFHNIKPELIRHCVDSMLAQRFDEPYEILLVDDASTDGTPEVLAGFARQDRVRVVRLEANVGPGGARNAGVREAVSDLVTFVDGDDFVSPYYLAILVNARRESGADLVGAAHTIVPFARVGESIPWGDTGEARVVTLGQRKYINDLCYERANEAPWNKLAPRRLYLEHPFPESVSYEDVAVAGEHILATQRFALVDAQTYGYVMRPDSVVHRRVASYKQATDFYQAIGELLDPLTEVVGGMTAAICYRRCLELVRLHSVLRVVGDEPTRAAELDARVIAEVRGLLGAFEHNPEAPQGNVRRFRLLARSPRLYDAAFSAYEAVRKGVKR